MRFSAVFQLPAVPQHPAAAVREPERVEPAVAGALPAPLTPELPEDLDARVRLIGEWQLGEGY